MKSIADQLTVPTPRVIRDSDTICNEIASRLEFQIEEQGIGAYEFHGAKGYDSSRVPVCSTNTVEVDITEASSIPYNCDLEGCEVEHDDERWTLNPGDVVVQFDRIEMRDKRQVAIYQIII